VADLVARCERAIASRRGAAVLLVVALAVYGLQSIALPVIPGRDFGTYLRFYVQMFDWDSVLPMSMLFRTPVAPLVVGGSLDLVGGYGMQVLMAVLYATSIVCWARVALVFSRRAALLTAAALLLYPGYGILFHMLASDSICAVVFALWALALTRAWLERSPGRYALLGLATAAAALTRPGYQVLVVFALVPLVRAAPWRVRLASTASCLAVVVVLLGAWTVNNGLRYDDYAVARGGGAFFPFYRAFTSDRIVSPENGPASRELADAVRARLLPEEPYRSYGIGLDDFFEHGSPREFEDLVGLTDRVWGWDSDYAQLRRAGIEAVRTHPLSYLRGVSGTVLDELASPLYVALPRRAEVAPTVAAVSTQTVTTTTAPTALPPPSEGEQIPAAHQGFFSTTPDGSITEVWTSATDHGVVFADPRDQRRFGEVDAAANRLDALVPPYPGSRWLTLQFSRSSKLFPPPLLWLVVGLVAWIWRRPARAGLAACVALAAMLVVSFQALAVYSIIEFAVPVAPALVVFGAAGLLGERRPTR
jgi:Dolichyl-phosphate-mannose-protein mannosyltransferase